MDGVEGGNLQIFGKGARHVHTDTLGLRIEVEMTGARHAAFHADQMTLARSAVAHFHGADVAANCLNDARKLMPDHHGHRDRLLSPFVPCPDVEIGAAYPGLL